jgi:large conductance mechanosensitive channel
MSFFDDFKTFAFKGNIVDLAIGVVIGGAFGKIVTALVNDIIMPVVSLIMPSGDWRSNGIILKTATDPKNNVILNYGDFLGSLLDFLIIALVLYLIVSKIIRATAHRFKRADSGPVTPVVRECPFCLETIPIKATRCKACTSELPAPTSH